MGYPDDAALGIELNFPGSPFGESRGQIKGGFSPLQPAHAPTCVTCEGYPRPNRGADRRRITGRIQSEKPPQLLGR